MQRCGDGIFGYVGLVEIKFLIQKIYDLGQCGIWCGGKNVKSKFLYRVFIFIYFSFCEYCYLRV